MPTPTMLEKDTSIYPLHTQTHTCKHNENCGKHLRECTFTPNQNSLFVPNPLVAARAHAVTAHQSSVGGQSFDYLLRVTAWMCSLREASGVWASVPATTTPLLLLLHIAQDNVQCVRCPPAEPRRTHSQDSEDFFLSFTILALVTFFYIIFWRVCSIKCPVLSRISQESFSEAKISK